ncbi:uncharacterized protein EI97DRAFT_147401 [Westerdykella ornata]|uniref:Uncharacterized protein n=1 Tax=Westerdykella ornata TaxID=318751 RepID=A0A6A6JBP1_WESOR|nr:uncharacterized protein EI97DRAFT_147401 [Westerdykella ornata]KAF2273624.1 hypothetical protein EI97DRAFT_147401 [Westerdykella ornata]
MTEATYSYIRVSATCTQPDCLGRSKLDPQSIPCRYAKNMSDKKETSIQMDSEVMRLSTLSLECRKSHSRINEIGARSQR